MISTGTSGKVDLFAHQPTVPFINTDVMNLEHVHFSNLIYTNTAYLVCTSIHMAAVFDENM
jgi:hypothetical protein